MNVIFLDCDGVINCYEWAKKAEKDTKLDEWISLDCLDQLKRICDETNAEIVLTSSWRLSLDKADRFSNNETYRSLGIFLIELHKRRLRIWDVTADLFNRGQEIQDYLNDHDVDKFVIIDDEYNQILKNEPNQYGVGNSHGLFTRDVFVQTDYYDGGLTKEKADEAIKKLNN